MASRSVTGRSTLGRTRSAIFGAAVFGVLFGLVAFCLTLLQIVLPVDPRRQGPEPDGPLADLTSFLFGDLLVAGCLVIVVAALLVIVAASTMDGRARTVTPEAHANEPERRALIKPKRDGSGSQDLLNDERWMRLVKECVDVVDELDLHMGGLDEPRREIAEHVVLRLEEMLERSGVEVIADEHVFDRGRHKPESADGTAVAGARIEQTLSPGFAVGPRVLRRARVKVL